MTARITPRIDDELWSALGDPTRRQILDLLLADGAHTSTSLSDRLPVTRQAVAKHLVVLDRAGLVRSVEVGRERRFEVDERRLARAAAQLQAVGAAWDTRLSRIKHLAESIERARKK